MPSIKWSVEPVFLSKKAIPPDKSRINELECNINNTLVGVLRQLASLVQISEKMFGDLNEDCRQLCERTINLKFKVNRCQHIVNQLNAKSVKVPVSTLNSFMEIEKHYKSEQELSNNLFGLKTRPQCVRDGYLAAGMTPLHIIRSIDRYRDDDRCGSKLFICQPVFANSRKRVNFDIETRRPASLVLAHELPRNVLIERAKTPLCESHHVIINKGLLQQRQELDGQLVHYSSISILNEDTLLNNDSFKAFNDSDSQQNPLYGLISPEERMQVISQEYPSKYVPIDVTGTAFNRMSHLRRSLIHTDFLIKRKKSTASKGRHNSSRVKRRNTICQSANELSSNGSKGRIRRRSIGSIDFVNTSCQTEFNESEIYTSGRIVDMKKCKNKSMGDYNNNSQNNVANNGNNSCDNSYKRETKIKLKAEVHHYESRSLDNLIDSGVSHQRRNQFIDSDITELSDSNDKTVDETNGENNDLSDKCKPNQISNLTAVKMRDTLKAKGVGSDGRSSSGNWSASSSTHASESVDSDHQILKAGLPHSLSNSSLGKDSVISDTNTTQTTQTESEGRASAPLNSHSSEKANKGLETGDKSNANKVVIRAQNTETATKVQYANRDSESWLQYYDSSDTVTPTPTESECGTQTTRPQTTTSCSGSSRRSSFNAGKHGVGDDEVESVYSVDNDGYYTSMHTDSGLFRLPVKLMITPNSSFRVKGKRDSIASVCTVGDISINSILSKTETESSTTTLTNNSSFGSSGRPKMPPPPPPPRVSSMLRSIRHSIISNKTNDSISENGTTTASNTSTSSRSHSPSPATITSESDQSEFASQHQTFKAKTVIDSSRYPSLCAITSNENSDDCRSNSSDSGSNRMTPTRKMLKSRSGSYIGFRIKDIFGFGDRIKEERSSPLTVSPTPHIATIRRPQSPLRFNMYTGGDGGQRVRRFIDKFNASAQNNTYQTPNIVRANAISSFASDSNECSDNETKIGSNSCAIKTAINEEIIDEKRANSLDNSKPTASRPVPNPRLSTCGSRKVPQNTVHPLPRQVSIPVPKPLDRIPSKPQDPTQTDSETKVVSKSVLRQQSNTSRPNTPSSGGQTRTGRSGARVTLDADGSVIYASNSLGRRRDGHPLNYLNQLKKSTEMVDDDQKCATLPKATKPRVSSPVAPQQKSGVLVHIQPNGNIERIGGQNKSKMSSNQSDQQLSNGLSSGKSNANNNETTTSMSANSHPANASSSNATTSATPVSSRCVTPVIKQQSSQNRRPTTPAINSNSANSNRNSYEKTHNKAMEVSTQERSSMAESNHIKRVFESDLNNFVPKSTSSPMTSQQKSQISVQKGPETESSAQVESKSDSNSSTLRRGRLTTEDLLIIIHNSKKKHNIKTEPEIIIANSPPSSRSHSSNSSSNSPPNSLSNGHQMSQQLSGSRPNTPSRTPQQTPDRRSWGGTETNSPNVTTPGSRRSLASDRLGPTKPTTMNDFKRLLSQTRSNTFNNERLSAAEILRANTKRPLTPVIKCITSFVGSGKASNTSRVTPSPAPTPTPFKQTMSRVSPAPSPAPPPQIINGAINANTPNLIKPRIINSRSFRHPPAYRVDHKCQPILEDSAEEMDDKKCGNVINNQMINSITNNNRYYTQKFINKTPVINNYNKTVANPQSTSTWV